ncbi:MAG: hypothetical protein ACRC5M_06575 [Anaeroplasmataceae bacterium]
MSFIDIVIIILVVVISLIIIYYVFIKNRKNPCKGCAHAKACNEDDCSDKTN